jgi:hypothetical protein
MYVNDKAHRPYPVHRHVLSEPGSKDAVLYEEGAERSSSGS